MIPNIAKKINNFLFIFFFLNFYSNALGEVIILRDCNDNKNGFLKNEYILDLDKSLMIRNFIYDAKTYKKYKLTDLSTKKENSITRFIYTEGNKIFSEKLGYPQFYTQLLFEKNNTNIKIITFIDNESGVSNLSTCNKIENFEKES